MSTKPKKRKQAEEDWIYDPIVMKGILRAKKELDEALERGDHLPTLEELVEKFNKQDAKKIHD